MAFCYGSDKMALKINIHDIREIKSAQIKDTLTMASEEFDFPIQEGVTWHPVFFDYSLTNADNMFVLQGKLESQITLECSRCLKPIDIPLSVDVVEQFGLHQIADDEDIHIFYGEEIDATEVLRDNILLNLPVKPLCSSECLGLCPVCGLDKNEGSCSCDLRSIDPRLAVLEKFISK